jgi:hypothetical protein
VDRTDSGSDPLVSFGISSMEHELWFYCQRIIIVYLKQLFYYTYLLRKFVNHNVYVCVCVCVGGGHAFFLKLYIISLV